MGLPKDPSKREAYLENMRSKLYERLADPEKKRLMDEKKREAALRPEVKERRSIAQRKWRAESDPEKLEVDKQKRREALKRPEVSERISQAQKKRFTDPEQRQACRKNAKDAWAKPGARERGITAAKEGWSRPEARARMSESTKRRFADPEQRRLTSEATKAAMKEVIEKPEYKAALKEAMIEVHSRPEYHEKLREVRKIIWQDPEYVRVWSEAMSKVHRYHGRTSIELMVAAYLTDLGIEYEEQKRIGRYSIDLFIPSKNLVVECDGEYWHAKSGVKERDKKKDAWLQEQGYSVLRLSGKQITNGEFDQLYRLLE